MSMFRFRKNQQQNKSKEIVGEDVIIEEVAYRVSFNDNISDLNFKTLGSIASLFSVTELQCKKFSDGGYKSTPKWVKDNKIERIIKL